MRIVVCDDDEGICTTLEKWLFEFQRVEKVNIDTHIFSAAETMLDFLETGQWVDILILDIELPGMSGIEVTEQMRQSLGDYAPSILYISGNTGHCPELFRIGATDFLDKPLDKDIFFKKMNHIMKESHIRKVVLHYEKNGINCAVLLRDILYFVSENRLIFAVTVRGEKLAVQGLTLLTILDRYGKYSLVQCHRSYVVNLSHLKRYTRTELLLDGDVQISIGKRYQTQFRNALFTYERRDF